MLILLSDPLIILLKGTFKASESEFVGCFSFVISLRALLKTSESELARRLSGHKTGRKPRNTTVFLCFLPFFCLENPQAFSNSRFLEVP